jgi:hypothetical protein
MGAVACVGAQSAVAGAMTSTQPMAGHAKNVVLLGQIAYGVQG